MNTNYIANEMMVVAPFPLNERSIVHNGQIKLKLYSERGQSKWLNISPEQFSLIEKVLTGEIE